MIVEILAKCLSLDYIDAAVTVKQKRRIKRGEDENVRESGKSREIFLCVMMSAGIASCGSDQQAGDEGALPQAVQSATSVDLDVLRGTDFLKLIDGDVAALWLALQDQPPGNTSAPSEQLVSEYEVLVRDLATRLLEDRRMIANRTVQTRDELSEHGIRTGIGELLTGLQSVALAGVVGNYGTYCDYYINLREQQLDHEEALAEMKALRVLTPVAGAQ